ncbi:MAG: 2-oxo acid dehydrogenase subunit E2 [Sandaracinaceae bacterium]|nr:2-oxo acid dehydrogenase subunit E2 [Sandaracinaceae bacterium]
MSPKFAPLPDPPSFQRWAAAQWRRPNDPTIYGATEIDMTRSLELIERKRAEWDLRLTVTHLVTKALALAIARHPRTNVKVRFWGKLEQRDSVDIIVLIAGEGGRDLSAHRIAGADKIPLRELASQVIAASDRIRKDEDPQFRESRDLVQRLPWWVMRPFLGLASLCMNELHLDLSKLGLPVDLFGAGMVTSLGMHGIDEGYAPLTPIGRIMVDVLVPRVRERPWVQDGQLTVRPTLKLCATFDHRVVDGVQAARLGAEIQSLLSDPERLL